MPQPGMMFRAHVASPRDCAQERKIIPEVISLWNAVPSRDAAAVKLLVQQGQPAYPCIHSDGPESRARRVRGFASRDTFHLPCWRFSRFFSLPAAEAPTDSQTAPNR